jgi:hypothetical protein
MLPLAIFLSIWSYKVSTKQISIEFLIATIFSIYIVIVSAYSPCPPLVKHWLGGYLVVLSWIMCSCMYLRIRFFHFYILISFFEFHF